MKWPIRLLICWIVALLPSRGGDLDIARMAGALRCDITSLPDTDRGEVIAQVANAHRWNAVMISEGAVQVAAIDYDYLTTDEILMRIQEIAPLIVCVAREFGISPALVAGIIATAQDLDYNQIDSVVDRLVATGWGDGLSALDISAGLAGVHYYHLRPALARFGEQFSASPFYREYYRSVMSADRPAWIRLASRYPLYDVTNVAAMARHYAELRMGLRPLFEMTAADMAFVWSAYRGGVSNTHADPRSDHRWSLERYQRARDPFMLGDTLIALAYFRYYCEVFSAAAP